MIHMEPKYEITHKVPKSITSDDPEQSSKV